MRNSSTACRNRAAPRVAAFIGPPSRSTKSTNARAPAESFAPSVACASSVTRGSVTEAPRAASMLKLENPTRSDGSSLSPVATMARCRSRANRSRQRAPSPAAQSRMVSRQTPSRRATSPSEWPSRASATERSATSTPVTLPGSASHGRVRSRAPQPAQTASATASTMNFSPAWSFRETRLPEKCTSAPPHVWHLHPCRSSSPRVATASS